MTHLLATITEALTSCSQKVEDAEDQAQHLLSGKQSTREGGILSANGAVMPSLGTCLGKNTILTHGMGNMWVNALKIDYSDSSAFSRPGEVAHSSLLWTSSVVD